MGENNARNTVNPGTFGPGVLGQKLYDEEQGVVERQADIFGPGVIGLPADGTLNVLGHGVTGQEKASAPTPPTLSVKAVRDALDASPLLVDTLLAGELARPDRRKGALQALAEAEERRPGGARPEILESIAKALGVEPAPAAPPVAPDAPPSAPEAEPSAPAVDPAADPAVAPAAPAEESAPASGGE